MKISQILTTINFSAQRKPIKFIVIHYTANNGDTAKGNCNYFKTEYRGASAHYFVDEKEICQCVPDNRTAWHCGDSQKYTNGGAKYKYMCDNSNSIGIELCSRKKDGDYYFKPETILNAIELVQMLCKKYNVPYSNIIRHYDVTGKICPAPMVNDTGLWQAFKAELEGNQMEKIYNSIDEIGKSFQDAVKWAIKTGIVKGDGTKLALTQSEIKGLVFIYRDNERKGTL